MHFPDTYKTPFHKTFSNESKYAPKDAPHWEEDKLVDKHGKVIADESKPQNNELKAQSPINTSVSTKLQDARPEGLHPGEPTIQEFLGKVYKNPKYVSMSPEDKKDFNKIGRASCRE